MLWLPKISGSSITPPLTELPLVLPSDKGIVMDDDNWGLHNCSIIIQCLLLASDLNKILCLV